MMAARTVRIAGSLHFPIVTRLATLALTLTICACRHGPLFPPTRGSDRVASGGMRRATTDRRAELRRDIDTALSRPEFARTYWGVAVQSLQSGETLYSLNERKLMLPASNMKIVTLAAAAEKLGWDYTYETTVRVVGTIESRVLHGDVVIVGSGDPSLMAADGAANRVFASWANQLKASGIQTVTGRVIGDASALGGETLGFGWSWDDLPDGYAAGVGALQLNEDAVRITVAPGPAEGAFAAASMAPAGEGLAIDNFIITAAAAGQPEVRAQRLPGATTLTLRGSIPVGHPPVIIEAAVDNPTRFFVKAARAALIDNGIDVRGPAVDRADVVDPVPGGAGRQIASYRSLPLATLAERLMKASQNQYAETLLKTAGPAQPILRPWGIGAADLIQRDGSGLSRYDYVTAEAIVTILAHIDRDARLKGPFEASLPIGGKDGSLAGRMKGTAAEGNARAKTGSMSNVRALSGYVTSGDGEPFVFSIIANNFDVSPDVILRAIDEIVVRLAQFTR